MMISTIFKKTLAVLLCLSFLIFPVGIQPVQAMTEKEIATYLNKCYRSIRNINTLNPRPKIIASAYLVGDDDMAAASWLQNPVTHTCVAEEIYAVEPGTEIGGVRYNSSLYPQDNWEYLKDVLENYASTFFHTNRIYRMPKGAQYIEREGAKLLVVDCDEEWATIWDPGYQSWNVYEATNGLATHYECTGTAADLYLETHPAGFYKVPRSKVWIDFNLRSNHPYQSADAIPKAGQGTVTKLVNLRPVPDETEKQYTPVYALPVGTQVNVVSTKLVSSKASGSTKKYYKVSFNGSDKVQNNTVYYMHYKVPGVYYLDSRFLNFTRKGTKSPAGAVPGVIINVKKNGSVYAYTSKSTSSEQAGILTRDAEIEMFPSESDASWTAVYFSGQKRYVQTKYIKKAPYKVTDISNLNVADIVKDEIRMSWNAGKNNTSYSCSIATPARYKKKGKVLWSDGHYKKNSLIIKRKYIEKYTSLDIKVQATDKNGKKGKVLSRRVLLPSNNHKMNKKRLVIGRTKIKGRYSRASIGSSLQYATNKKFKKAVTVEKYYNKNGRSGYKPITVIKKLKPKKTYYIRRREKKRINTKAGVKWLSGKWSKYIKIKTKK